MNDDEIPRGLYDLRFSVEQSTWREVIAIPPKTVRNEFNRAADEFLRKRGWKLGPWTSMDLYFKSEDLE